MSVAAIIPWKPGCAHRERILPLVVAWWERQGIDVVIGRCEGEWSKAVAVADGLERCDADTLIIADADVILAPGPQIWQTLEALESHGWAVPHLLVCRWDEAATTNILAGRQPDPTQLAQRPYRGWLGGGIAVITRALYEAVPLDPRFVGWGQEDEAWAIALDCLAGAPWRGDADLWHLWHPPQVRRSRSVGSREGVALRERYKAARRDPMAMVELLREAR